ncbi:MAG: hypothetical protein U0T75_12555 [Chitinophagales bacterium]
MYRVAALLLLLGLSACSSPEKLVCSHWQASEVKFTARSQYNLPEQNQMRYTITRDTRFQFKRDSVYELVTNDTQRQGTWWLSVDKKKLYTVLDGDTSTSIITTLTKKVFAFDPQNDAGEIEAIICYPATTAK